MEILDPVIFSSHEVKQKIEKKTWNFYSLLMKSVLYSFSYCKYVRQFIRTILSLNKTRTK